MHTIKKEFHFSASHQLEGLPHEHPCSRLHGHNYIITLHLRGELNEVGFVIDYRDLDPFKRWVDESLDHRHLNEVFPAHNPTVENMTRIIWNLWNERFPQLIAVEMSETPKTSCYYEG